MLKKNIFVYLNFIFKSADRKSAVCLSMWEKTFWYNDTLHVSLQSASPQCVYQC